MQRRALAGAVVFVMAAAAHLARLGDPPGDARAPSGAPLYVYDECYQAFTAHRYALADPNAWNPRASRAQLLAFAGDDVTPEVGYEWVHPPTAKLVMAAAIRLFGFRPFAYRLGSALAGLLVLFFIWRLAARLRGEDFGAFALLLAATDGMLFVMSRVAMNDIYLTACVAAAAWALERHFAERARGQLALAGALLGLGLTMKWSAAPLYAGAAALGLVTIALDARRGRPWRAAALEWLVGFVVAPPALYLASYTPYFAAGHGLGDLVELHRQMIYYQSHLRAGHAYGSPFWQWPLVTRPVWLFERALGDGRVQTLHAMGNPILWWAFVPAIGWAAVRWARRRVAGDGLMVAGFLGAWLPWMIVRRVTFAQYLLPAVPFGIVAVAAALDDARARWRKGGAWLMSGYAALSFAAFVYFYPIWSGWPVAASALRGHRWFWFASWR